MFPDLQNCSVTELAAVLIERIQGVHVVSEEMLAQMIIIVVMMTTTIMMDTDTANEHMIKHC